MVGVRRGAVRSWLRRAISRAGTRYLLVVMEKATIIVQWLTRSESPELPSEVELPVEATPRLVGSGHVFKGFVRYHINDGTHNSLAV